MDQIKLQESAEAAVLKKGNDGEQLNLKGYYKVKCFDAAGNLKWEDDIYNIVPDAGKRDLLDKYLGGTNNAAYYMGLVTGPGGSNTYAAGDTMASHAGWAENQNYSEGARPTLTFAAASGTSKATSSNATFSINAASQTIAGCFVTTNATKGGTTGILFSVGNFSGGDKSVGSGDTLSVSYTLNA